MTPPAVASVALEQAVLVGAGTVAGTVTLDGRAPAGGTAVTLAADDAAVAVPPSVTVPAGQETAGFSVTASAVPILVEVTVSATAGGAARSARLALRPPPPLLEAIWVDRARLVGGDPVTAMIGLGSPAPDGGLAVALEASGAVVPAGVQVPAGAAASPAFAVQTPQVAAETACQLRASAEGSGVWTQIVLAPPHYLLAGFAVDTVGQNEESVSLSWTATLNDAAPAGGIVVAISLVSATPALQFTLPASVTVPAGSASASFPGWVPHADENPVEVILRATLGPTSRDADYLDTPDDD